MTQLLDDLSTLTTIPKSTLQSLMDKEMLCISHSILENLLDCSNTSCIDIGIGDLIIEWDSDEVRYKFVPSCQLEKQIISTINTGESPLIKEVEETLKNRIMNTYKDLF